MDSVAPLLKLESLILGGCRVYLLDSDLQPSLDELRRASPSAVVSIQPEIQSETKLREWYLSRLLLWRLTGYIPGRGPHGEPDWGVSDWGSLSHKRGHVALAFGSRPQAGFFGLDLEESRDLDGGVVAKIMIGEEFDRVNFVGQGMTSAVFSAKEAIYKCLFNRVGRVFYFDAVRLTEIYLMGDDGVLTFKVERDLSLSINRGKQVRVHLRRVRLAGKDFWLNLAKG